MESVGLFLVAPEYPGNILSISHAVKTGVPVSDWVKQVDSGTNFL